jgi:hypothetical protein
VTWHLQLDRGIVDRAYHYFACPARDPAEAY